jgi:hypothetical protein
VAPVTTQQSVHKAMQMADRLLYEAKRHRVRRSLPLRSIV